MIGKPMASSLRSDAWYSGQDRNAYIRRAWMRRGVPESAFEGRPQIAIANTASDLTPCNLHLTEVAASVRNGVRRPRPAGRHRRGPGLPRGLQRRSGVA